jgi:lycopene beta-cyclase
MKAVGDMLQDADSGYDYDIVFVGCGLANGLAAYLLSRFRPSLRILVVDQRRELVRSQTWSFHDSDLRLNQLGSCLNWLADFQPTAWDGHVVHFPAFHRRLPGRYWSIRGDGFGQALSQQLGERLQLGTPVAGVTRQEVRFADRAPIRAKLVIDGRGWQYGPSAGYGYQKFVGQLLRLNADHGLTTPVIMDARVPQDDGFRFFYLLPYDRSTLLVEDTRYSLSSHLDTERLESEIAAYCDRHGWQIADVLEAEQGCLPIPMWDEPRPPAPGECPSLSGLAAGHFHPTTGYSLTAALGFAAFLEQIDYTSHGSTIERELIAFSDRYWHAGRFYRRLNNMLFLAAAPEQRYRVLERFYRLSDSVVERFYAQQLGVLDRLRILAGKPPVPLFKGITAFLRNKGAPYELDQSRLAGRVS